MEIKIGVGMGKIVFGMSLKEVKNLLGEPNKISETEKESGVVLTYNEEMTKYKFDKDEDYRLYSIEVYNSEVIMFGQKVIGMSKEQLINFKNDDEIIWPKEQ